jgi:hypothetical protein
MSVTGWEIDHEARTPRKGPHTLFMGWGTQTGHLRPITIEPARFFPGWGKRVNWIEIEARASNGTMLDFCLDNLLLNFYDEKDKTKWSEGFHDGLGPVITWDQY